ncbi:transglutaminase domain-containing protein [Paenibacillus motobuensis]|uniref:DUF4129 domain-containing transglutaminase family protein n=1 Tax=Paenibacillus motobuensis TaxID=295324 RepID=A0ABN0YPR0_9BACL
MKRSDEPIYWYRVSRMIWVVILGMQWVRFTEPIWFQQTTDIVTWTLIIVAAIDLLPIASLVRNIGKLLSVAIICRVMLIKYGIYMPYGRLFPDQILQMLMEFIPYIWFALITWLVLELISRLLLTRKYILLFLAADLIAFAILDSFTPYQLWQNVAWTVFAGLGWLVCLHLRDYQLSYPHGWRRLQQYPFEIIFNILLIFAGVLLIGTSVPSVSPILTDPYTAWKGRGGGQGTGSEVQSAISSAIKDKDPDAQGVLSGYSRDDTELGGGFEFNYSPVMSIDSPLRTYWRGETRHIYTGNGWADFDKEKRDYEVFRGLTTPAGLTHEQAGNIEMREVEQTITMQSDETYPVLFGGYFITKVSLLDEGRGGNPKLSWAAKEGELRWGGGFRGSQPDYPVKYKVTSEIPVIPLTELRGASYKHLYAAPIDEVYLQVPSSLSGRVKDLAEEITADADTPFKKMELLQEYLRMNYVYTNKPDISLRRSKDFVDSFLFEVKEGYCDYFSTAMVMMARSQGIPARWVKGYGPGRLPDSEDMRGRPALVTTTAYQVNNSDAHSWAELYFGEYGWIPFEATPGFTAPLLYADESPEEAAADESEPQEPVEDNVVEEEPSWLSSNSTAIRYVSLSIILVALAWLLYQLRERIYYGFVRLRLGRSLTYADKIAYGTLRTVKKLQRQGFERHGHETVREAFERIREEQPELSVILDHLLQKYESAIYSPNTATNKDWLSVQQLCHRLSRINHDKK